MPRPMIEVSLLLTVHDPEAFAAAARKQAVADGITPEDAAEEYTADNLRACAQMLFDPGISPPGCSIEYSHAEEQ